MRVRLLFALVPLLVLAVAGCVTTTDGDEGTPTPPATPRDELLARLEAIPAPEFDVSAAVTWWQSFVETYVKRDNGLPNNVPAAEHIRDELAGAGFDTRILTYETTIGLAPATVRVVEGIKVGNLSPDRYVGLIAHYDTQTNTIQGAYDDGSGVAVELSICKLLARVTTNKTVACLFFDAEERGLVGSREYVADKVSQGDESFQFVQAFGYDMVGLNWPGYTAWDLYAMAGLDTEELGPHMPDHLEFLNVTLMQFLASRLNATTTDGVTILDVHDRNSDEQNFKRAGVPVVRFAGGRRAADYPQYHLPQDTADYVYEYAGGRANFEKGFEFVVVASYYTILAYDQYDPVAMPRF